ncbi:type IX secretion system plug protein domain-containing protein [Marinoscillum sp. MHG1-6]|uniref:type IX secretion system plug protein n=1 Tax=Marinoscillum sp. MHG1-6 TaxID=2959627 RepID=UPI00215735F4|nr:type IX secretion system plug protein domain-containing protein [Marinoscillum sp. MHG1-6]
MKYYSLLLILSCYLFSCVPVSTTTYTTNKQLTYEDQEYEPYVGFVQVFSASSSPYAQVENPVIKLGQTNGIQVVFDLLEDNYHPISLKLIHCDHRWTPSGLADIRFLDEYNSFNVPDYQYSSNTRIPYISYTAILPTPKISGNYLIVAYNGSNERDILFSRRVLVFESRASVAAEVKMSPSVSRRSEKQQIDFGVAYKGLGNLNPLKDLNIVILQNHRWSTANFGLQPTQVRADQQYQEYSHLTGENEFPGGNEYRFIDFRSVDYRGMNISNVIQEDNRIVAFTALDKPRGNLAYSQLNQDINGSYYLQNTDPGDIPRNSEYAHVFFELSTPKVSKPVYIIGRFNNWAKEISNQMSYDEDRQSYRGKLLLKQGFYNYAYESEGSNSLEGDFFQTRNEYEILVYYRNPTKNYDELVGYQKVKSNF